MLSLDVVRNLSSEQIRALEDHYKTADHGWGRTDPFSSGRNTVVGEAGSINYSREVTAAFNDAVLETSGLTDEYPGRALSAVRWAYLSGVFSDALTLTEQEALTESWRTVMGM